MKLALCIALVWLVLDVRATATRSETMPFPLKRLVLEDPRHARQLKTLRARVRYEHRRFVLARHRARVLRRVLMSRTSVRTAIDLACTVYGSCSTLHRRAYCESRYSPWAYNASSAASGLFQFLPSTWATTPFASFSIFDPYANALAAGWMQRVGRGGEWVCR